MQPIDTLYRCCILGKSRISTAYSMATHLFSQPDFSSFSGYLWVFQEPQAEEEEPADWPGCQLSQEAEPEGWPEGWPEAEPEGWPGCQLDQLCEPSRLRILASRSFRIPSYRSSMSASRPAK